MHWGLAPGWMTGYWATREVTSYQFYLIAGMVMALAPRRVPPVALWARLDDRARHRGRRRGGRGLVLPVGGPRHLVARFERRPVPTDRDPLQRGRHRLHLPDRRACSSIDVARRAHAAGRPLRLGQLLRRLPGPAPLHHHPGLAGLAPARRRRALAAGQRAHRRHRVPGLRRPDRAVGPDALEQASDRTLAGTVAACVESRRRPGRRPSAPGADTRTERVDALSPT